MVAASMFAVLIGVIPVSGQQKTSWFSNPFTVSSGTESIPSPDGGSTMQAVTLVTPSRFSIDGASARTHWGVGYQPEFDIRYGTGQMNSWNHSADASFGHLFSRRTKLDFGHTFVKSSDPARTFTDNIFVMPQNNFRENATAMTLSHQISARTTMNFRFDNTITRMSAVGNSDSTILNQYGVAGTTGISQRLGQRHKITLSYSLLKFSPYRFDTAVDAAQFAANIPVVTAGIARFGSNLAISVSRSSPIPTGLVGGGQEPGASPAPQPSSSQPSTTSSTATANVSVAGQDVGVTVPTVTSTAGGTATVAITPSPAPTVGGTTALPSVSASVPVPSVSTVSVAPATPVTVAITPSPASTAIPSVSATVPVPSVPIAAPAPAPAPTPVPIVSSAPVVPLVPSISVPSIDPTVPLVGVVTPLPTTTSTPTPTCQLVNNTCTTTTNVTTPSGGTSTGVTSTLQGTTSTITKLSVAPTSATPTAAAPTAADPAAASTTDPPPSANTTAGSEGTTSSTQLLGRPFHVVSATYTYAKDPGLLIEMSGGVMRDREMSYLMSLQVERRFDRLWVAGGFQRFLSFFGTLPFQGTGQAGIVPLPNGVQGRSVFSALTGRVGGKINRRTQLEMSVSLSKSTANFVAHDLNSAIARGRISYWLTERLSLFADVDSFYENVADVSTTQYDRQRYFGGVQVRFSPAAGSSQKAGN
jgi:hypothetical protein